MEMNHYENISAQVYLCLLLFSLVAPDLSLEIS